mmetsp:Transcript_12829/g.14248  ORF Transcript_12829/g.14248 Transcript_12829/m.14248 type:complete len:258 (-) Transcript_12829:49-822(-)
MSAILRAQGAVVLANFTVLGLFGAPLNAAKRIQQLAYGPLEPLQSVFFTHGAIGFYTAIYPSLISSIPVVALRTTALHYAIKYKVSPNKTLTSFLTSVASSVAAVPAFCLQTRLIENLLAPDASFTSETGLYHNLFNGYIPLVLKYWLHNVIQYQVFEVVRKAFKPGETGTYVTAFLSSIVACVVTLPFETIAAHMCSFAGRHYGPLSLVSCVNDIYEKSGIWGFFAGFVPELLYVGFNTLSHFELYMMYKKLLDKK